MAEVTGPCLVAFLDLLGFSARLRETWGTADDVLPKLLAIKRRLVEGPQILVTGPDGTGSYAEMMTISDSILVESAAARVDTQMFYEQVVAVTMTISKTVDYAVQEGFGMRGALELGPLYRSPSESIGPAFLDVYALEQAAGRARVVIGPRLATVLADLWGAQLSADGIFYTCSDKAIAVQPAPHMVEALTAIQSSAGRQAWRYDEIIRVTPRHWNAAVKRPRSRRDFLRGAAAAASLMDGSLRDQAPAVA